MKQKPEPSILFRLSRIWHFLLNGIGKKETEHYLFTLDEPMVDVDLYQRLAGCGWTPNYMGYRYRGQIYQCRRLVDFGKYQYHVRLYDDGTVTGHFEIAPEWDAGDHLNGVDLRTMNRRETNRLHDDVRGITMLRRKFPDRRRL